MNSLDPSRAFDSTVQGLAADAHSLDALKRAAKRDPQAALKGAAQQFEALFLQMVLKSMRDAVPKSGLLDTGTEDTYTGMLDQQLANRVATSGTGLAGIIARQLARYVPAAAGESADQGTPPAPGAPAAPESSAGAPVRAALDRYAQIASANPNTAAREAELNRRNPQARAEYLARTAAIPADLQGGNAAGSGLSAQQRDFVLSMWDHAAAVQRTTGIAARFVLAQAALESGWGAREMRDNQGRPTYNLFGIKAGASWQGRSADVVTTEYEDGVANKVVQKFRAYDGYGEAFRDWAQLIAGNERYAQVLASGRTGTDAGFAHGLARAGYATDPQYGSKLTQVIGTVAALRGKDG